MYSENNFFIIFSPIFFIYQYSFYPQISYMLHEEETSPLLLLLHVTMDTDNNYSWDNFYFD